MYSTWTLAIFTTTAVTRPDVGRQANRFNFSKIHRRRGHLRARADDTAYIFQKFREIYYVRTI